jgi:hypothetical protein
MSPSTACAKEERCGRWSCFEAPKEKLTGGAQIAFAGQVYEGSHFEEMGIRAATYEKHMTAVGRPQQ